MSILEQLLAKEGVTNVNELSVLKTVDEERVGTDVVRRRSKGPGKAEATA